MKQGTLVAIILAVLVFVSAVQALQLTKLKKNLEQGGLSVTTSSKTSNVAAGSSNGNAPKPLPSNIQDLPQMVGGC